MATGTEQAPSWAFTESLLHGLDNLYLDVRKAYLEVLSRATTEAEQALWRSRAARFRQWWELQARDDAATVAEVTTVLRSQLRQVREHIDQQISTLRR